MSVDYANQISNVLCRYLPYKTDSIGYIYNSTAIEIVGSKVIMTFLEVDYDDLSAIITTAPSNVFTTKNFVTKNLIDSVEASSGFFLKVETTKPHQLTKGEYKDLAGFTDTSLNVNYYVVKTEGDFIAYLYNDTVNLSALPTSGFGYMSNEYKSSLNDRNSFTIEDATTFKLSFEIDLNEYYSVASETDLDLTTLPKIYYYDDNVKVINANTFLKNLTDDATNRYLIVDTASLAASPLKSKSNDNDANYSAFSNSAYIERGYSITLRYLIQRNVDDIDNQTGSGSDIVEKQIDMEKAIDAITREPLSDEDGRLISSMTLANHSVNWDLMEGSLIIDYELEFYIITLPGSILEKEIDNSFAIENITQGTDTIIMDNY